MLLIGELTGVDHAFDRCRSLTSVWRRSTATPRPMSTSHTGAAAALSLRSECICLSTTVPIKSAYWPFDMCSRLEDICRCTRDAVGLEAAAVCSLSASRVRGHQLAIVHALVVGCGAERTRT